MSLAAPKTVTADILEELSQDGRSYEIVKGVLVEVPPVGNYVAKIEFLIAYYIQRFLDEQGLEGEVLPAAARFRLERDPETVRGPDVSFIRSDRLPEGLPDGYQDLAPDLAVEVVSKSNDPEELEAKIVEYFEAGTGMVWVVYPRTHSAYIYTSLEQARRIGPSGYLDGGEILPGFQLSLKDLFAAAGKMAE
ncbi:MAG: Uma2 family endonuclease [Planctomycetota bacterium]|nr:Uma2 family endonuclease [Planctomycetota bacterium]